MAVDYKSLMKTKQREEKSARAEGGRRNYLGAVHSFRPPGENCAGLSYSAVSASADTAAASAYRVSLACLVIRVYGLFWGEEVAGDVINWIGWQGSGVL